MASPAMTTNQNTHIGTPFPAWRLPGGRKNANDGALERASKSCESWAIGGGLFVVLGLFIEAALAYKHPPQDLRIAVMASFIANLLVLIGVATEVLFAMLARNINLEIKIRSDAKLSDAAERAAEANRIAEQERHARAELEAKLQPRSLNQDQWDFIQGLRGKFPIVSIAYETDAETWWFAGQIRDAFFSAGISVAMYPRDASVHSFGTFIFEPNGFEGARPRTAEPLVEIFRLAEFIGSLAVITELPTDVVLSIENTRPEMRAPLNTPMIIVGGRFVLPPPHIEKAAMAAKAAMDKMRDADRVARESSI